MEQQPYPLNQSFQPQSSGPSHNIWLWVSVILLAIIILGGVFWYFNIGNYISPTSTLTPTPSESASPSPDEFKGWQTYRNEEYRFELKYPDGYVLKSNLLEKAHDTSLNDIDVDWFEVSIKKAVDPDFAIFIEMNNQGQGFAPSTGPTKETIIVNGITVDKHFFYDTNQGSGPNRKTFLYFFDGNGNRFIISGSPLDDDEVMELADRILSTFKFIP